MSIKVAYFGLDSTDRNVIKRIAEFKGAGVEVVGFTFRRDRLNRDFQPDWDNIHLGWTADRRYASRIPKLVRAIFVVLGNRRKLEGISFICARNVDLLAVALIVRSVLRLRVPLVYEVLDVQRIFLGTGLVSRLFRAAERWLMRGASLLAVSSPAFHREYYRKLLNYDGPWYVLENKVSMLQMERVGASTERTGAWREVRDRWVIGWFGTLRCPRSPHILARVAERLGDDVLIYMRGYPTETGLDAFLDVVDRHPNMVYEGEYRSPQDLAELYGRVHFSWCVDFLDEGANSDWLLPNRLYEGGLFGSVALAAEGTEIARVVRERELGKALPLPLEDSVVDLLRRLTRDEYREMRSTVEARPRSDFADAGEDVRAICEAVLERGIAAQGMPDLAPTEHA